jgi:hypothetical protein
MLEEVKLLLFNYCFLLLSDDSMVQHLPPFGRYERKNIVCSTNLQSLPKAVQT